MIFCERNWRFVSCVQEYERFAVCRMFSDVLNGYKDVSMTQQAIAWLQILYFNEIRVLELEAGA